MEFIQPYSLTVLVFGLSGFTFLVQLLIADVIGLKAKHTPGFPIEPEHSNIHFRSSRAIANTNESIGILILIALFGILSHASPTLVNSGAVIYLVGRIGHMIFYYSDLKLLRSCAFVVSLVGLFTMLAAGILTFF